MPIAGAAPTGLAASEERIYDFERRDSYARITGISRSGLQCPKEVENFDGQSAGVAARRLLGGNGPEVFPISLGCMGMSGIYGEADETESIATIHAALDRGINLIDTGDFYGMGHNELLVGRALRDRREKALLSVKFGALRGRMGAGWGTMRDQPR